MNSFWCDSPCRIDKSLNLILGASEVSMNLSSSWKAIVFPPPPIPHSLAFLFVSRTNAQTFNSNKWIKIEAQHFVESHANTKKHKFYPRTRASIIIVVIASLIIIIIIVWVSNIYFIFFWRFIVSAICISLENYFLRPIEWAFCFDVVSVCATWKNKREKRRRWQPQQKSERTLKQICRWRNVVQFTHWIRSISSSI